MTAIETLLVGLIAGLVVLVGVGLGAAVMSAIARWRRRGAKPIFHVHHREGALPPSFASRSLLQR